MTSPDWVPAPTFDTVCMAGNAVEPDVLTESTMLSPWAHRTRVQARSLETPGSNTYRLASDTVPDWNRLGCLTGCGLISYQLTWAPAPPRTLWATHTAVLLLWPGSIPETAWVIRPSRVSRVSVEFFCGASGGDENDPTVMSAPLILNCGTAGLLGSGRSAWT